MNLIHGDCLVELKTLPDKSIDFFYLDLPFGVTACHWDKKLDHKALWVELRRLAKSDRTPFFFSCTTKFGFELFNSAPKGWFRWDLVWKKNRAAGFLNAYRLPMRKHEMIYCFAKKTPDYDVSSHLTGEEKTRKPSINDKYLTQFQNKGSLPTYEKPHTSKVLSHPLPTSDITPPTDEHELVYCFAKKTPDYDVSSHKEYTTSINNSKNDKFLKEATSYFSEVKDYTSKQYKDPLPTSDITQPSDEHELVYCFAKKTPEYDVSSHNDFYEQGESYKLTKVYDKTVENSKKIKPKVHKHPLPTSDITPSSWCEYKLDTKIDHRTAKPIKLMEFLLKYWTKEGATVCDPTAGSGSMGIACKNMNRKFIGIEKDDKIFQLMKDRIDNHKVEETTPKT